MEYIEISRFLLNSLILGIFLLLAIITLLVLGILRYRKNSYALERAKDDIMEANMDLEAHAEELMASQEEIDRQFQLIEENKAKMQRLVDYDQLTGYMTSHKFISDVTEAINSGTEICIIYINISNLDEVSSSLGFGVYEALLVQISESIRIELGDDRYGYGLIKGNDLVLTTTISQKRIQKELDKLLKLFDSPFYSDYITFKLLAKIGVACCPEDDADAETLIKKAGIAAISQNELPTSAYTYFSKVMQQQILNEQRIFAEIDQAIKENQFIMHYQPKFASDGQKLMGYEALIRWQMPDGTLRPPSQFIDLAEKTGQIVFIGRQVIDMVCQDIKTYALDKKGIHVSLNLSSQHLENDDTISYLKRTVNKYDVDSRSIEIEITETSLVKNYELTRSLLKRLRHDGFTIALDDFGTGYSSLSYIRNLPINKIKIDREFISRMPNVKYMKVLKAIMNLSKDLYYRVTVEGIETKEQWDMLRPFEPNELQGFYFSKPLPIEEAIKYID